jgi:hypothetical protein
MCVSDVRELPLGAQIFEEHNELQLEEDDRVDAGPASASIQRAHQLPHEGKVEPLLKTAVEVVFGDEVLQRYVVW